MRSRRSNLSIRRDSKERPHESALFVAAAETSRVPLIFAKDSVHGSNAIFANQSFLTLAGLTHADVLGRPIIDILADLTDPVTLTTIDALLRAGRPARRRASIVVNVTGSVRSANMSIMGRPNTSACVNPASVRKL